MMKNKKFVSVVCVILAMLMMLTLVISVIGTQAFAVSQSQIDALEDQKKELKTQRQEMQTSIDGLENQKADVLQKKQALDEQNEVARQEIELINEQIDLYGQLIEEKAQEVEDAKAKEAEQLSAYQQHVRSMEENGKYSYLSIIFKSKSLGELLSNIDMVGEIMDADKRLYDQYTAARENTERVKAEYEETLLQLQDKQDELAREKKELESQIAAAVKVITDLEADIAAYEEEYNKNEQAENALNTQIANLTAQMKAEEEAARKAAEEANKPYTGTGSNATGSYTWPCPSSTYITSGFGWRIHPIFGTKRYHNGVDISANSGSSVVAADSGTVSVATYSSSAGNYVVLYHSGGTTTTYMHLSSIAVSVGETVTKGQTIGAVGSTGWSTGPHLHFQIEVNGSGVNPLSYFSNYTMAPAA